MAKTKTPKPIDMTDLEIYSAYLPYKVKVNTGIVGIKEISGLSFFKTESYNEVYCEGEYTCQLSESKLILRPLSDILKVFPYSKWNWYEQWQQDWLEHLYDFQDKLQEVNLDAMPSDLKKQALSKHIDLFNLIDQNKAIDVNTMV